MPTDHALVQLNDSGGMGTGCSRCGATDKAALALPCPAISDGAIYQGKPLSQEEIDCLHFDFEEEDDETTDDLEDDCGLMRDGQCTMAGTEYCDFECSNRESELFCGSAAWRKKHPE